MKLYELGTMFFLAVFLIGGGFAAYKMDPEFRGAVDTAKGQFDSAYDQYVEPYRDSEEPEWAAEAFEPKD